MQDLINKSTDIVVLQADNPDGDSLASSLALEQILSDLGKTVYLYCGVDIPSYLRYMPGYDRVSNELPKNFDLSIVVDTSSISLFEQADQRGDLKKLRQKPCIVIDHHVSAKPSIDFATVNHVMPAVATGEIIYELCQQFNLPCNTVASNMITSSIMSDSLGLTSEGTSARSIAIISELVASGVSIAKLENQRRALQKKSPQIIHYKSELLSRIEYAANGRIALIHIPWAEIEQYSAEYNPSVLVLDEMRQITEVQLAVAFKTYPDGRITGKLRANYGYSVADKLAAQLGGGGHPYAAGFRVNDGRPYNEVKSECIRVATQLLDTIKGEINETSQYTYTVN